MSLVLHDGEEVVCLVEMIGPKEWQAVPVRDIAAYEVATLSVDCLPSGGSIRVLLTEA